GAPVAGEVFEVAQGYPALPADAGQLGRPAGVVEPAVQVVQGGLRDVDTERLHRLLLIRSGARPPRPPCLCDPVVGTIGPSTPRQATGRADPGPGRATAWCAPS